MLNPICEQRKNLDCYIDQQSHGIIITPWYTYRKVSVCPAIFVLLFE